MQNTKKFQIGNEDTRYSLYVNDHTGTATNELMALNTNEFSTFDNDNDQNPIGNCAYMYDSGWWHGNWFAANLNGKYYQGGKMTKPQIATGIHWSGVNSFSSHSNSLIFTEIRSEGDCNFFPNKIWKFPKNILRFIFPVLFKTN